MVGRREGDVDQPVAAGRRGAHDGSRRSLHSARCDLARASRRQVDTARTAQSEYCVVPVPRISKEELKQRLDAGVPVVVVDARLKYPYEHSTVKLPGAVRVLADTPVPSLPRDREIVVYDSDPNELARTHVAAEPIRSG